MKERIKTYLRIDKKFRWFSAFKKIIILGYSYEDFIINRIEELERKINKS
jgi:hypothetical protein